MSFSSSTYNLHQPKVKLPIPPCATPSSATKPGAVGGRCLSAASLARRPAWRAAQGTPEGGVARGALLFGYLILGKQNKVSRLAGKTADFNSFTQMAMSDLLIVESAH